jgi:hypothetical protein
MLHNSFVTYLATLYYYEGAILLGLVWCLFCFYCVQMWLQPPAIEWSLCTIQMGSGNIVKLNIIFVFYVFRRLVFSLVFIYVIFILIGRMPWCELQLIDLYIDFQSFFCAEELVSKKLEARMELMRGFKGSMEVYLFMRYVIQVKYMWMFIISLQCCSCMGRSSTYQDGSSLAICKFKWWWSWEVGKFFTC